MKTYYVLFKNNNKPICGCWKRATSKENAIIQAEFSLMCKYSNVTYDSTEITDIRE